jgi:colanic acid biosynthesis glycosyl transferase WcaI
VHILVINQYFHPDQASTAQILTELCEDLSERHEVTVVAGRPSYNPVERANDRGLISERRHGRVRVLRTLSTTFSRAGMAGRIANYATYMATSMSGAMRANPPDVVLAMTDPPMVAAMALATSRLRGVPFVYVNQDVFPDVGVILGRLRNPALVKTLARVNRTLREQAAAVVAIGRDMEQRLVENGVPAEKIRVIPNWADGSLIRPLQAPSSLRAAHGWNDHFVVMHSGNVGLSQDLRTLVGAADLLQSDEDIRFVVIGEGASKAALERDVNARGLTNIDLLPYQPKASLSESLGAADVHFVGLRRGLAGAIVPSKVYGIMAAGKPIVAAIEEDSEPAMLIREHQCGVRVEPGDAQALASAILEMRSAGLDAMGKRGREALDRLYDRPIATGAYRTLLEGIVQARAGR